MPSTFLPYVALVLGNSQTVGRCEPACISANIISALRCTSFFNPPPPPLSCYFRIEYFERDVL